MKMAKVHEPSQKQIHKIISILRKETSKFQKPAVSRIAGSGDPFRILISCILSLRTKDNITSGCSSRLFQLASDPYKMNSLSVEEIEKAIYPCGFYRQKAHFIKSICKALTDRYNGKVPDSIEELLKLKGVGRKTANLVITLGYNKPGICVDTHVHRIVNRWGYVETKNPHLTEFELRKKLPKRYWKEFNGLLVSYGQHICKPVAPYCSICKISMFCKKVGVKKFR